MRRQRSWDRSKLTGSKVIPLKPVTRTSDDELLEWLRMMNELGFGKHELSEGLVDNNDVKPRFEPKKDK